MKKIQVICKSTEQAIIKKSSTLFLRSILNELDIENKIEVLKIYKRVKSFTPISDDESSLLMETVKSNNFKKIFEEKSDEKLDFINDNNYIITYSNLLLSLVKLTTICKIQNLLIYNSEIRYGGKTYIRIEIGGTKVKFCEIIEEEDDILVVLDLKSGKYLVIDYEKKEILTKSKNEPVISEVFKRVILPDGILFVDMGNKRDSDCIIFSGNVIKVTQDVHIYNGEYALFLVDKTNDVLYQIEKDTYNFSVKDISLLNKISSTGRFIITQTCLVENFKDKDKNEDEINNGNYDSAGKYIDGSIDIFNLELNKNVINNIHPEYQINDLINIFCMSIDLLNVYHISIHSGDVVEYNITDFFPGDISNIDNEKWLNIVDILKKDIKKLTSIS